MSATSGGGRGVWVGVVGGLASLVLAGGVAAAVTQAHLDPLAVLPALCRDNPGSAGGALPGGRKLDALLKAGAGTAGPTGTTPADLVPALGSGSGSELQLRVQALQGSATAIQGSGQGEPGSQGGSGTGGSGTGTGAGNGNGRGAGGTGGQSGNDSGPAGGQGTSPVTGNGPDANGVPQAPNPKISPPPVIPPAARRAARHPLGAVFGPLLILLLVAAVLAAGYLLSRGRGRRERQLPDGTGMVPAQADALAQSALAGGDLDAALRWTFVSGLLRLDQVEVLRYDPTRTTSACAAFVASARFPVLAVGFDLVAYGGRHATMSDVTAARQGWNQLLVEVVSGRELTSRLEGDRLVGAGQ